MLKDWTKLLPYFVVEWLAKKGERFEISTRHGDWSDRGRQTIVRPYLGVYIAVDDKRNT